MPNNVFKDTKPIVLAIVGPTCTGKTSLSLNLAKQLNGEIISCDSRAIYKGMDIGTAKPTVHERSIIRHHLIDVLQPDRFFSVAEFKELADVAIADITQRHKIAIVCGGTGLYARALLEGITMPSVEPQPEIRTKFNELANNKGNAHIHDHLRKLDPIAAKRLSVNDRVRIIRALEVSIVAGKPFSSLAGKAPPPFKTIWAGLRFHDRTLHKQAIIKRLKEQFINGLKEEALNILNKSELKAVARTAVNYKEFVPYLEGRENLEHVFEQCVTHNFQLAKRQLTWFRANPAIQWFNIDQLSESAIISQILESFRMAAESHEKTLNSN